MNVDFLALSSAVHQANHQPGGVTSRGEADVVPRKVPARRRNSVGSSSSALQFLEAAQQSWNFAQEDLPSGETTALQRRKSLRVDPVKGETSTNAGKKKLPGDDTKSGSPGKPSLPRNQPRVTRRASLSGSLMTSVAEDKPVHDDHQTPAVKPSRRGRLSRRSSLQPTTTTPDRRSLSGEKKKLPMRRFTSDPTPPSHEIRSKMTRRNTMTHAPSSLDDSGSSLTKNKTRRSSSSKTSPVKGSVRFEVDHRNRIKRRVSVIRKQNSRTHDSALWWSQEELDRIYERENKVYEKFADNKSYKRKIQKLWGSCSKASSENTLTPEAIAHVAGSPSRGLEVDILETVRDRRARVIGSLLDAQETLRDMDPQIRTKVLSARYKNLCKAATRFARKMGEGDEMEAANIYHPTSTPTATKE